MHPQIPCNSTVSFLDYEYTIIGVGGEKKKSSTTVVP